MRNSLKKGTAILLALCLVLSGMQLTGLGAEESEYDIQTGESSDAADEVLDEESEADTPEAEEEEELSGETDGKDETADNVSEGGILRTRRRMLLRNLKRTMTVGLR